MLGKGVVVTRAREQASGLVDILRGHGACVHEFPTISVDHLDDYNEVETAILQLARYQWVVFTSVNGVKFFWEQLNTIGLDSRIFGGMQIAAIGPATADELRARGIMPDFVPEKYVAEHVVEGLLKLGVQGQDVLIPRARVAREVLPEELKKAGCNVTVLPVYETRLVQQSGDEIVAALDNGDIQYITFTSSSTVENFFELVPADTLRKYPDVKLASIGPVTSKTLSGFGFTASIEPEDYTIPGLVGALVDDMG
jgi:uroporphyrinogen III methyltransferase/synthase